MEEFGQILGVQLALVIVAMTAGFIRLYRSHTMTYWSWCWSRNMLVLAMALLFAHMIMTLVYLQTFTPIIVIPRAIVDTIAVFAIQLSVLLYFLKLSPSQSTRRWLLFLVIYWSVCSATWLIYLAIWFPECWPFWYRCEETIGQSMLALTCIRIVAYIILFIAARSTILKSGSFLRRKRPVLLASLFCFIPCLCILPRGILLFAVLSDIRWWIRLDDLAVAEIATAIFFASLLQLEPVAEKLPLDPVQAMQESNMVAPPPYTGSKYIPSNDGAVQPQSAVQTKPAVKPQLQIYTPRAPTRMPILAPMICG